MPELHRLLLTLPLWALTACSPQKAQPPGGLDQAGPAVPDASVPPVQTGVFFPPNSGVIDVTLPPYGAKGDGVTDDTQALQQALSAYPDGDRIIYLPSGTYLLSGPLRWPAGPPGQDSRRTTLQGQGQATTTLRLLPASRGFTDPTRPQAVIAIPSFGGAPQRVGNAIFDLSLEVGAGNPGAIGVQFLSNGQGGMRSVTIHALDGLGVCGLDLGYTGDIGPALFTGLSVTGFGVGVRTASSGYGLTFEGLTLSGQSVAGFQNYGQVVSLRGLTSANPGVHGVENTAGVLTIIDSALTASPASATVAAIYNKDTLFARQVTTGGYKRSIYNVAGSMLNVDGPLVTEFVSAPPLTTLDTDPGPASLGLPVITSPVVPWDQLPGWASVTDYGAVANDSLDDSPSVQAAIDAGKGTVYFPLGAYVLNSVVQVRGAVRRVIGMGSRITGSGGLELDHGGPPAVIIERFDGLAVGLTHASSRSLVLSDLVFSPSGFSPARPCYGNTGTGDLYVEDVYCPAWVFSQQRVWARQLDADQGQSVHLANHGGQVWVLGLRADNGGVVVQGDSGGQTEVLGGLVGAAGAARTTAMFDFADAKGSLAGVSECGGGTSYYNMVVSETQTGQLGTLLRGMTPQRCGGSLLPLYVSAGP